MNTKLLKACVIEYAPIGSVAKIMRVNEDFYPDISCGNCGLCVNNLCLCIESETFGEEVNPDNICLEWEAKDEES